MRWLAGVALLLLVCGAPGTASAKSPADARCGPSGARTVLITDEVRVAYKADNYSNVERVYGCWLGGRTQVVYDESCDDDTGCYGGPELWVAGRYVAYANFDCLRAQACGTVLGVRDLAARRSSQHAGPFSIWRLDIGSDGTLVWTRGAPLPLSQLASRLKCPRGSRRVALIFHLPREPEAVSARHRTANQEPHDSHNWLTPALLPARYLFAPIMWINANNRRRRVTVRLARVIGFY